MSRNGNGNAGLFLKGMSRARRIKKKDQYELVLSETGAAGRNRTHDPLVRSQVLYPAELQPRRLPLYKFFSFCTAFFVFQFEIMQSLAWNVVLDTGYKGRVSLQDVLSGRVSCWCFLFCG